jgi:hypothetical protein
VKVHVAIGYDGGIKGVFLKKGDAQTCGEDMMTMSFDLNTGGEPIFVLRGQDKFATGGIKGYQIGLEMWNQTKQADEVQKAMDEMIAWQARHADRIKNPDHQHVPAVGGGA